MMSLLTIMYVCMLPYVTLTMLCNDNNNKGVHELEPQGLINNNNEGLKVGTHAYNNITTYI